MSRNPTSSRDIGQGVPVGTPLITVIGNEDARRTRNVATQENHSLILVMCDSLGRNAKPSGKAGITRKAQTR